MADFGDTPVNIKANPLGGVRRNAADSAFEPFYPPRYLFARYSDVQPAGTASIEDLYTDSIPAATLRAAGDMIRVSYSGAMAAVANRRRVAIVFNTTTIAEIDTSDSSITGWCLDADIIRVDPATVRCVGRILYAGAYIAPGTLYGPPIDIAGLDLFGTNYNLKCSGRTYTTTTHLTAKLGHALLVPAS